VRQRLRPSQLLAELQATLRLDPNASRLDVSLLHIMPEARFIRPANWWVDTGSLRATAAELRALAQAIRAIQDRFDVVWPGGIEPTSDPHQTGSTTGAEAIEETLSLDEPFKYRIGPALGVVELSGNRTATLPELAHLLERIVADPMFRPGIGFLRDRRGLGPLPPRFITAVTNYIGTFKQLAGSRLAIVVDPGTSHCVFGLVTIPGGDPFMVRSFDDGDEARLWLASGRQ